MPNNADGRSTPHSSTTGMSSAAWCSNAASTAWTKTSWPSNWQKSRLWLHTFTVGAPFSFLDHHLRCGDSLFGLWVQGGIEKTSDYEASLFLHGPMTRALRAASSMQIIEGLTDAEIAEAHRSADVFAEIQDMTAPLDALLCLLQALDWLELDDAR